MGGHCWRTGRGRDVEIEGEVAVGSMGRLGQRAHIGRQEVALWDLKQAHGGGKWQVRGSLEGGKAERLPLWE